MNNDQVVTVTAPVSVKLLSTGSIDLETLASIEVEILASRAAAYCHDIHEQLVRLLSYFSIKQPCIYHDLYGCLPHDFLSKFSNRISIPSTRSNRTDSTYEGHEVGYSYHPLCDRSQTALKLCLLSAYRFKSTLGRLYRYYSEGGQMKQASATRTMQNSYKPLLTTLSYIHALPH